MEMRLKATARIFQSYEGLDVDGKIGNESYKALQQTDRKFSALKKGMNGNAVKVMQTYLIKLGYLKDASGWKIRYSNRSNINKIPEKANNLDVDGVAGIMTLKTLYGESPKSNTDIKSIGQNT